MTYHFGRCSHHGENKEQCHKPCSEGSAFCFLHDPDKKRVRRKAMMRAARTRWRRVRDRNRKRNGRANKNPVPQENKNPTPTPKAAMKGNPFFAALESLVEVKVNEALGKIFSR